MSRYINTDDINGSSSAGKLCPLSPPDDLRYCDIWLFVACYVCIGSMYDLYVRAAVYATGRNKLPNRCDEALNGFIHTVISRSTLDGALYDWSTAAFAPL